MAAKKHSRLNSVDIATNGISGTYNEIQSIREASLSASKTMVEATTREDGQFTTKLDGLKTLQITLNCAWDESDSQLMQLVDALDDNTTIHARWRHDAGSGLRQARGEVKVSDVSRSAPTDDMQTVDVTLDVTGSVTYDTQ